jgi:Fe-S-cluster containining protein
MRTMNAPAAPEPIAIPSLSDAESRRLGARMADLARTMADCDGIDTFAQTGWLPDAFFDTLEQLYATYDQYIKHNIAASRLKTLCQFGCTRCCHQAVYGCYAFEIINLYRQLRARDDYGQLHDAFVRSADEFQQMFTGYAHKAAGREDLALVNTLQHFAALAKPCPLLADGNCRVYAQRPISCRMYYSLTNPVYCTTVVGRTFHLLPPQEVADLLVALNNRLAFPYSEFLAQGLVVFAAQRQFRPWTAPVLHA